MTHCLWLLALQTDLSLDKRTFLKTESAKWSSNNYCVTSSHISHFSFIFMDLYCFTYCSVRWRPSGPKRYLKNLILKCLFTVYLTQTFVPVAHVYTVIIYFMCLQTRLVVSECVLWVWFSPCSCSGVWRLLSQEWKVRRKRAKTAVSFDSGVPPPVVPALDRKRSIVFFISEAKTSRFELFQPSDRLSSSHTPASIITSDARTGFCCRHLETQNLSKLHRWRGSVSTVGRTDAFVCYRRF